jgi:phosphopantetheinyl transferase
MEEEDFFLEKVTLQNNIRHPHKRLQHLAGRTILRQLFPDFPLELILIADTRKPFLTDEAYHFSISHCGDYAAAIVSSSNRVGVDIEIPQPKITAIQHKFLTDIEMQVIQKLNLNTENALTLCWSIKEAIFKWYGSGKVDFREHIHIEEISFQNDMYTASCVFTKDHPVSVSVHGLFLNDNWLTWICTVNGQ